MAAAYLLALRDFTLISVWPQPARKSEEESDECFDDHGSRTTCTNIIGVSPITTIPYDNSTGFPLRATDGRD
ncbi:hypothetical protein RB195_024149 [Necator americanus]|uniref:Uncharacterized protein n=1 Tax=Necator americanus TaxID=51031 RepID=A0ABR1EMX5_NECAM